MGNCKVLIVLASAIAASALLTGCGVSEANVEQTAEEATTASIPVGVASSERGQIVALYAGTAALEAEYEAPVVAKVGGEIVKILVEEGDSVEEGQILAQLDGRKFKLIMDRARADLDKLAQDYERNMELNKSGLVGCRYLRKPEV